LSLYFNLAPRNKCVLGSVGIISRIG